MKALKFLFVLFLILAGIAVVVMYCPKIREYWDRWLACTPPYDLGTEPVVSETPDPTGDSAVAT